MGRGKMGVSHRGLDIGVPEELLDGRKINPFHDQMRGKCMSQGMEGDVGDARFPHCIIETAPDIA